MDNQSYTWTDNPTVSGVSPCNTDVLNECLMHLKYNQPTGDGFRLFDIKITDRKLIGEEAVGWVIQGGLVTMTYPDAVNQIIEEFDEGVTTTYRGISCVQSLTGHYIADISKKSAIDQLFSQTGIADFYILDKTNRQFYLPRNKWFMQLTTDDTKINQFNEAGLPNHQHSPIYLTGSNADLGDPGECYMTNNGQQNGVRTSTNSRTGNVSNNSLYGKSSTVQPQSSNKLLYYKVGNVTTGVGEILIDAQEFLSESTQQLENAAQDGLNDIETAINDGVSAISNVSNALKQNQITNCLLEVPQRVKVELNDGSLTLKAGSVVIVPYGTSAPTLEIGDTLNGGEIVDISWDGQKLFYYVRYEQDKTSTYTPTSSYNDNVFARSNGAVLFRNVLASYSGDSAPTISSNYALWYDTANNIVKQTENQGQTWENYLSLPFCIAGVTKSVGITSLENIFNGFGFIGSTVWIDKGVKALIPNGRNADGSLKNIEYTTSKIIPTQTNIGTRLYLYRILQGWDTLVRSEYIYIQDEQPDAADFDYTGTNAWFSPGENYWRIYENGGWQIVPVLSYAYIDCGNTTAEFYRPVSFKTKQAFRAVDYNDTEFIAHQAMPSETIVNLSVGASGTTYTAPADGYVTVYGKANSSNDAYLDLMSSNSRYITHAYTQGMGLAVTLPVAKSCIFKLSYLNINISAAYFTYANGAI